jgi:two-component system chemotaxis response regulator CheB
MSTTTLENEPRQSAPWLIVMAASIGGIEALRTILAGLPGDFPAPIVVLQHRLPDGAGALEQVLRAATRLPVRTAAQGDPIQAPGVYVARADSHLTITPEEHFLYRDGTRIRFVRASANPLLESAARVLEGRVIAVVLSGSGMDGTDGVQAVKAHGGVVIAQDELSSFSWGMPKSAIQSGAVDYVLPVDAIAPALSSIVHGRAVARTGAES